MNDAFQITFGLLGGLAIFIFGMNMMSESLQKAAGEKMKKILGILTVNPVMGVLAGTIATAVMQSSSATTVMVIGFVSAGLMTLKQGISVILGANIGTTMTAQLLAFNISDYIFVIIFVGFIVSFVFKSEKIKSIGQTIFAFGLLFEGIQIMSSVMKPLAASPVFINMIDHVSGMPVLGVLVGTLMTLVVQSSSATIAVLQNFAAQAGPDGVSSIIGLAGAIPVLLGDNIGTTITALLACIGQSRDAKRTALAHCTFNITGAFLFIWFVKPYAHFIQAISTKGPEVEVIARQIANAHTIFNITMTLIWLPLIWLLVKIVVKILPYKEKNSKQKEVPIFLTGSAPCGFYPETGSRCKKALRQYRIVSFQSFFFRFNDGRAGDSDSGHDVHIERYREDGRPLHRGDGVFAEYPGKEAQAFAGGCGRSVPGIENHRRYVSECAGSYSDR